MTVDEVKAIAAEAEAKTEDVQIVKAGELRR